MMIKIPIYPIFYLLEGDYSFIRFLLRVQGFKAKIAGFPKLGEPFWRSLCKGLLHIVVYINYIKVPPI